ncbi:MAG: hypothetical protein M1828_002361 [Chrysothrix sp. TS-e1954]|nr:MAG: hypothetical protein M1828_002361 [Chrysothrix sp. TS-e1954]
MEAGDALDGEDDLYDLYSESPALSSTTQASAKRKWSISHEGQSKRHKSGDFAGAGTPSQSSLASYSPFDSRASSRQTSGYPAPPGLFPRPCSIPQPPRNAQDAKETRLFRCAEIQRRCKELEDPIHPSTLQQLDAYRAASLISAPLTESAWNVLRPRLLTERACLSRPPSTTSVASHQQSPMQKASTGPSERDSTAKEVKAANALAWETTQKPVREKLAQHVDDIVAQSWSHPGALTYDTCPRFAADALLGARLRYLSAAAQNGTDPSILMDNMKWLHDNKIKRIFSPHRRECFLCNGCDYKTRFYAFDSVVQHYAAKHTNEMSSGSVVVAWQLRQWPEVSPISPEPDSHRLQVNRKVESPGRQQSSAYQTPVAFTMSPHQGQVISAPHPVQPIRPLGSQIPLAHSAGPGFGGPTSPFDNRRPFWIPTTSPIAYGGYGLPSFPSSPTALSVSSMSVSSAPPFYQSQVEAIATIARHIWSSIVHIKSAPPSVRMYTIIVHVLSNFRGRFSNEPSLELFTDAVINHPHMTSMKDVTGLSCAACSSQKQRQTTSTQTVSSHSGDKKMFLFQALLIHFRSVHVQRVRPDARPGSTEPANGRPSVDWKNDMIDLPREQVVRDLVYAPHMDKQALDMFAFAFPNAILTPGSPLAETYDPRKPTFVAVSELHNFRPHPLRQSFIFTTVEREF